MNHEPEIEYTSLVDDIGFWGFYYKSSNKIYINPRLKEYPDLLIDTIEHEKQHYENSKKTLPIRIFLDILLDYKDMIKTIKTKKMRPSYSITEETYALIYDIFTFPLRTGLKNKVLFNCLMTYIFFSWLYLVLFT